MTKTLKNTALLTLSLVFVVAATEANAGCKSGGGHRGGHGHRGHHYHHHYRPVYVKPVYVAPKPPPPPCTVIPAGATITLPGCFGPHPGHVILELAGAKLHAKVVKWTPHGVTVCLPPVALVAPAPAMLIVIGCDKHAYKPFHAKMVPSHPEKPAGPGAAKIVVHTPPNQAGPPAGSPGPTAGSNAAGGMFGQGGIPFQQ